MPSSAQTFKSDPFALLAPDGAQRTLLVTITAPEPAKVNDHDCFSCTVSLGLGEEGVQVLGHSEVQALSLAFRHLGNKIDELEALGWSCLTQPLPEEAQGVLKPLDLMRFLLCSLSIPANSLSIERS